MRRYLTDCLIVPLIVTALLLPKISALILHLHPGFTTVVICTGTELVTLQIGPDGQPVESVVSDHAPCLFKEMDEGAETPQYDWVAVQRTHKSRFVENPHACANGHFLALLEQVRGPPKTA